MMAASPWWTTLHRIPSKTPSARYGAITFSRQASNSSTLCTTSITRPATTHFPGSFAFGTDSNNPLDSGYAYANAILGNYDTYNETTNRVDYAPITTIIEWFVQDKWRVTSRLTVDIGVRFTDALPLSPNNNNAANFIPYLYNPSQAPVLYRPEVINGQKVTVNPVTGAVVLPVYSGLIVPGTGNLLNGIIQPNTPGFPRSMVYGNGILPAPRLGFAYDPFGDGKTAIRGGAGIFYTNLLGRGNSRQSLLQSRPPSTIPPPTTGP